MRQMCVLVTEQSRNVKTMSSYKHYRPWSSSGPGFSELKRTVQSMVVFALHLESFSICRARQDRKNSCAKPQKHKRDYFPEEIGFRCNSLCNGDSWRQGADG